MRRHIRLRHFDYASRNAYFITACTSEFKHFFGEVRNGIMCLSDIGSFVAVLIQNIPDTWPTVEVDEFIVMPNHIHCILEIKERPDKEVFNQFGVAVRGSISVIINQVKGRVKKWCVQNGYNYFQWQSRFYDRVIRNGRQHHAIKNYIRKNPAAWWKKYGRIKYWSS